MSENHDEGAVAPDEETEEAAEGEQKTEEDLILDRHKVLLDGLRGKYDEIAIFVAPKPFEGLVVVAAPKNPKTYQTYVNSLAKDSIDKAVAMENFALSCVVHPSREDTKAIFVKRPAFAMKISGRAQELAGSDAKELGKD